MAARVTVIVNISIHITKAVYCSRFRLWLYATFAWSRS